MKHLQETEHVLIIHVQDGQTALYIASWRGHMEVMQLLLQKHADIRISKRVYHFLHTAYYTPCLNDGTPLIPIHVPTHITYTCTSKIQSCLAK